MEFGCIIWHGEYQILLIKFKKKNQNRSLRYHYFKRHYPDYRSIRITDHLEEFKVVCLAKRRNLLVLPFLHKIINNHKKSPEMLSLIPFHATSRFNRAQAIFLTPIISTTTRTNLVTMVRLANNIIFLVDLDWNRSYNKFGKMTVSCIINYSIWMRLSRHSFQKIIGQLSTYII